MNAGEIRTMASDVLSIVSGNAQLVLIPSNGYFEVGRFRMATSLPSVHLEVHRARGLEWVQV